MASFGPQVKNMAQAGAGGGGEKAFADAKVRRSIHKSELFPFPVSHAQPAEKYDVRLENRASAGSEQDTAEPNTKRRPWTMSVPQ